MKVLQYYVANKVEPIKWAFDSFDYSVSPDGRVMSIRFYKENRSFPYKVVTNVTEFEVINGQA